MASSITGLLYSGANYLYSGAKWALKLPSCALQSLGILGNTSNYVLDNYAYSFVRDTLSETFGWMIGGSDVVGGQLGALTTGVFTYTLSECGYSGGVILSLAGGITMYCLIRSYFSRPESDQPQTIQTRCIQMLAPAAVTGGLLLLLPNYLSQIGLSLAPCVADFTARTSCQIVFAYGAIRLAGNKGEALLDPRHPLNSYGVKNIQYVAVLTLTNNCWPIASTPIHFMRDKVVGSVGYNALNVYQFLQERLEPLQIMPNASESLSVN